MQQHAPAHAISRVTSCLLLALILQPLGFVTVVPNAEAVGVRPTLLASAVWALLASAIVLAVPGVRDLRGDVGAETGNG